MSFPFLVGYGFQHVRPILKYVIGPGVVSVVLFNVLSSAHLIKWWLQPPFAAHVAATPRIDGLIQELKQMGIDRCYASYWHAYRILFESNGDMVCAQPYNERFLGWPVPNKALIDEAPDARFVLATGYDSRFPVQAFTRHMQEYGIRYKKMGVGVFSVFGDFEHDQADNDSLVPRSAITLRSNAGEEGLENLLDADSLSFWSSVDQQQPGFLVEAMLDQPRVIHRVTLHFPFIYPEKPKGHSHSVDIQGLVEGNWITLVDDHPHRFDRLRFLNGHPVYGGMNQTIWFSPRRIQGLRVVINRPNPKRKRVLNGVELGEQRSGAFP